ncbi:RNA polymerase B [Dinochytrium kinnereticum]|nr:RNA polymerase B [Dinochytrium kinnereticum]
MSKKNRRGITEDEDAAELHLGGEFQDVQCLLISEVRVLLEVAKERNRTEGRETNSELFPENENFHQFEMAQLANLCCESVEEAKALIPSLNRKFNNFEDAKLQDLLDQMSNLRRYQTTM